MKLTRREFVKGTAAAFALYAANVNAGEKKSKNKRNYQRISCEEHFITPEIAAELKRVPGDGLGGLDTGPSSKGGPILSGGSSFAAKLLDLGEGRIKEMDENGVDMQVLLLTAPGVQLFDPATGLSLAKAADDRLAEAIKKYPTRLAGLAIIAPQDPAGTAKELERAVKTLGLKGGLINSHTNGEYLDEKKYWPILEAAESLDVPIYIHPRDPSPGLGNQMRILELGAWQFSVEVGTHALRMMAAGVFDQFPKLRIVLGHLGETLPFLLPRLDNRYQVMKNLLGQKGSKRSPGEYLRNNFVVTTSGFNYSTPVIATLEAMGSDKVLFATDYPYEVLKDSVEGIETIKISAEQKRKIFETNPRRVFGL